MKPRIKNILLYFGVVSGCLMWAGILPAATIDLTVSGNSGFINDAFFTTTSQQTTGTGVIDPFLTIQHNDTEKGYNTDYVPFEFDQKRAGATGDDGFTHSLLLSAVPEVAITVGGVTTTYREFLLDINEANGGEKYLSLDQIQIFLNTAPDAHVYSLLGTPIYDMDGGVDSIVLTNYDLNPGSGGGDLFVYIPTSAFGSDPNKYVYFYSEFGGLGDVGSGNDALKWGSSDGFEEWAVRSASTPVPEPGTMLLLGSGLVGLAGWGRKKFRR